MFVDLILAFSLEDRVGFLSPEWIFSSEHQWRLSQQRLSTPLPCLVRCVFVQERDLSLIRSRHSEVATAMSIVKQAFDSQLMIADP